MEVDYDDYLPMDFVNEVDNTQTISNIKHLNAPARENEYLRAVKIFQLNDKKTSETSQSDKIKRKEKIFNLLLNSKEKLEGIMAFLTLATLERPLYRLKVVNIDTETSKEKKELSKINFLKKNDCFSKAIELFKSNLEKINEKNQTSQIIFRELIALKELGFVVDDNFTLPEFTDVITFKIHHKFVKKFEDLSESKQDYSFDLIYTKNGNTFELKNSFYENFIKKHKISFGFKFKTLDGEIKMENNLLENIIDNLIKESFKKTKNSKYNLDDYLIFFTNYFLYFLLKLEIRNITKTLPEGLTYFKYKNFQYKVQEDIKEYSIKLNHFNLMEITFKIKKEQLETAQEDIENNSINFKTNLGLKLSETYKEIIKIFFTNLIYESKLYRIVKELYLLKLDSKIKKINFEDVLDNSLFIYNLNRISHLILRKTVIAHIYDKFDKLTNYFVNSNKTANFTLNNFTYRFMLFNNNNLKNVHNIKTELILNFNKRKFFIELKCQVKNNIFICERDYSKEISHQNVDFNYVFLFLDNLTNKD